MQKLHVTGSKQELLSLSLSLSLFVALRLFVSLIIVGTVARAKKNRSLRFGNSAAVLTTDY